MEVIEAQVERVKDIVSIHIETFPGFFLTFLGKEFLKHLYLGFIDHVQSNLLIAIDDYGDTVGFVAYSTDLSGFYKYLIKKRLLPFAYYGLCAFIRKPSVMLRLLRAFTYPNVSNRNEEYVELSSIGVAPCVKKQGIGSILIDALKEKIDFKKYNYIKLETDAQNNDKINCFYIKNGFVLDHSYTTPEGRKMNEYRYKPI